MSQMNPYFQQEPPKPMDLNGSMGPPSGDMGEYQKGSFKNPWTAIPRPMNRFMEVNDVQYERQQVEKQDLSKVLLEQMEEKKRRQEEEKRRRI
mmetsp:Transcript_4267/g.3107  ORF Transcript_4267/g.3107 Transcript_4267/m.3107 type:complete len:93 (-) Transcript_4267:451-729(-)